MLLILDFYFIHLPVILIRQMILEQNHIKTRLTFFILFLFLLSQEGILAQPGSLDKTFGDNGIVTTAIGDRYALVHSIAVQSDFRIVAAGFAYRGKNLEFAIARYDTNGTLDASFGVNGIITTKIDTGDNSIRSLIIQPDGKLVVAGYSGCDHFNVNFALARYNIDGSLDNSFGTNGTVITSFGVISMVTSSARQVDGKIVAVGNMGSGVSPDGNKFALSRYTTNGNLDSTFGTDGKITTAVRNIDDVANSVGIQADGKIIAAGTSYHDTNFDIGPDIAIVRYNTNGSIDTTFGTKGKVITALNDDSFAVSINIQEDQKIVVSCSTYKGGIYNFVLVRYTTDGSLDKSFGINGIVTTTISSENDQARSSIIQSDNKIVVIGTSMNNSVHDFRIVRYNQDGSSDSTFGTDGIVTTAIDSSNSYLCAVAIQHDGKILVGGEIYINDTIGRLALARYISGLNIGEIDNPNNSILIYPNPSTGRLTVETSLTPANSQLTIMNLCGQQLITRQITSPKTQIDISSLPSGVYFVRITDDKTVEVGKSIKE
jgi:uncharacterized delta-60 repeat protein